VAIDDPVGIELRQAKEEIEESSYLPARLARIGLSGAAAAALAALPFFSQVLTGLILNSSARFERRLLKVAEALEEQQKRIEQKIPDKSYYESEEFQSLLMLVLEKLHATHQEEKLKTLGEALANSGTSEFVKQDKEQYVRTLQELSLEDIRMLRRLAEINSLPSHPQRTGIPKHESPGLSRLASLGLVQESVKLRELDLRTPVIPRSSQSPETYARSLVDSFKRYFQQAPQSTYRISGFGQRFLSFIASANSEGQPINPTDPPLA
jgi:hypothetical protein